MCGSHKITEGGKHKKLACEKWRWAEGVLFNLRYYFTDVWLCIKIYPQVTLALIPFKEIKGDVMLFNIHLAAYNVILLWLLHYVDILHMDRHHLYIIDLEVIDQTH